MSVYAISGERIRVFRSAEKAIRAMMESTEGKSEVYCNETGDPQKGYSYELNEASIKQAAKQLRKQGFVSAYTGGDSMTVEECEVE